MPPRSAGLTSNGAGGNVHIKLRHHRGNIAFTVQPVWAGGVLGIIFSLSAAIATNNILVNAVNVCAKESLALVARLNLTLCSIYYFPY